MVRAAPWVVEEENRSLHLCLVGFAKTTSAGI